jgi:hypothetical protein
MELLQRTGNRPEQLLGLRSVAALVLETIDAKPEFSDAIFSLGNPLGYVQKIGWNAPNVVYPLLDNGQTYPRSWSGSSGSLRICEEA